MAPHLRDVAAAAGVEADIVHVPSDVIGAVDATWGSDVLGDTSHSVIFDNSKVRTVVPDFVATIPFEQGVREIVAWHAEDGSCRGLDDAMNTTMDPLVERFRADPLR